MSKERTQADAIVQGAANRALLDLILEAMRLAGRNQGYAIAVHGSLNRDIDLIAVPWREGAMDADSLVSVLCGAVTGIIGSCLKQNEWTDKPHGRKAITLLVYCGENHMQIDLSVMPRITTTSPKED